MSSQSQSQSQPQSQSPLSGGGTASPSGSASLNPSARPYACLRASASLSASAADQEHDVLDPHLLIRLFVVDGGGGESTTARVEEVMPAVQAAPMPRLLDGRLLASLQAEQRLGSYLSALLVAFAPLATTKIRPVLYASAVAKLRDGRLGDAERGLLQTHLLQYAHQLSDVEALALLGKIFDSESQSTAGASNRWAVDKADPPRMAGAAAVLELASRLCERPESRVRHACHAAIMVTGQGNGTTGQGGWPAGATLMLAAAATEMSSTAAECAATLRLISVCVRWSPNRVSTCVEPDELPELLFHAAALLRRPGGEALRGRVLDTLARAVDTILEQSGALFVQECGSSSSSSSMYSSSGGRSRSATVLATVVHHLSLLFAKDLGVATEVLQRIKDGSFGISRSSSSAGASSSQGALLLTLLAARVPRQEGRVLSALCEAVSRLGACHSRFGGDRLHFQLPQSVQALLLPPSMASVRRALTAFAQSPLMTEQLSPAYVDFALALLDTACAPPSSSQAGWSLLAPKMSAVHSEKWIDDDPSSVGSTMLVVAFRRCEHARPKVVQELSLRLLGAGVSAGALAVTRAAILTLAALVESCPAGVQQVEADAQDVFTGLGGLPAELARALVLAFGPLFRDCGAVRDRCWLAARKAAFSRDAGCREGAVAALTSLIQLQLEWHRAFSHGSVDSRLPNQPLAGGRAAPASSSSSSSSSTIDITEALSLLRRGLYQQTTVRTLLYSHLVALQAEHALCRGAVLNMLLGHLRKLTRPLVEGAVPTAGAGAVTLGAGYKTPEGRQDFEIVFDVNVCWAHGSAEPVQALLCSILCVGKTIYAAPASEHSEGETLDALEGFQTIWDLASACAVLADYELGIADDDDNDENALSPAQVAQLSTLQAVAKSCSIAVAELPDSLGALGPRLSDTMRFHTVSALVSCSHKWAERLRKHARNEASKRKTSRKAAGRAGGDDAAAAPAGKGKESAASAATVCSSCPTEILCILKYATFVMTSIYLGGDAENHSNVDEYDAGETTGDIDESARLLLTRSALENALCALEGLLALVLAYASSQCDTMAKLARKLCIVAPRAKLRECVEQLKTLSCGLLRFLIVLDGNEPTKDAGRALAGAGTLPQFEQGELALRCLLGCIRVAAVFGPSEAAGVQTRIYELLGPAYRLASHMKKHRAPTQTAALLSMSMTGAAGLTGNEQARGIKNIIKGFTSLFSLLLSKASDGDGDINTVKDKKSRAVANERVSVLLALFADLTSSVDSEVRQDTATKLLKECEERVQPVSAAFAEKMTALLISTVPDGPSARVLAAVDASKRVTDCVTKCSELEEEGGLEAEVEHGLANVRKRRDIWTRAGYFLSQTNLPAVINTLCIAFERVTSDAEFLHRLRDQRFRSSVIKKHTDLLMQQVDPWGDDYATSTGAVGGEEYEDAFEENAAHVSSRLRLEDEEERIMQARDVVDTVLHELVQLLLQGVCPLLTMYAEPAAERILALLVKIFRLQVRLAKDQISFASEGVPATFRNMFRQSSESIAVVRAFIHDIQDKEDMTAGGGQEHSAGATGKAGGTRKRKKAGSQANTTTRQAKIVPELIYQLEQLDVQIIAIAARDKQAKCSVSGLLQPSTLRDFRLEVSKDAAGGDGTTPKRMK